MEVVEPLPIVSDVVTCARSVNKGSMNATKNKILRKDRFFAITFFDFFLMAKILSFDALDYPILKGFSRWKFLNYDGAL